jgi:16S rRNA (adenine1518-N6/adenine1519-N6)-dimethyltransferase
LSSSSAIGALPPLREVIAEHGLAARKSLGQNFLLDLNLTRRIARSGGPLEGQHVIEVGPGPGGLTRALLLEGADSVIAIERDSRILPALATISAASEGRLQVIAGDALTADYSSLADGRPTRIVANLPYNVATPLLIGWLTANWPPFWTSMTLLFQKEVAERIVATPGGKAYGRLSVLAQWRTNATILFEIPPRAFTPAPKVTSALVRFDPLPSPRPVPVAAVEAVTAAAFGQRRKMLRASLRSLWPQPEPMLAEAGIEPTMRAEQIEVAAFLRLAEIFVQNIARS